MIVRRIQGRLVANQVHHYWMYRPKNQVVRSGMEILAVYEKEKHTYTGISKEMFFFFNNSNMTREIFKKRAPTFH